MKSPGVCCTSRLLCRRYRVDDDDDDDAVVLQKNYHDNNNISISSIINNRKRQKRSCSQKRVTLLLLCCCLLSFLLRGGGGGVRDEGHQEEGRMMVVLVHSFVQHHHHDIVQHHRHRIAVVAKTRRITTATTTTTRNYVAVTDDQQQTTGSPARHSSSSSSSRVPTDQHGSSSSSVRDNNDMNRRPRREYTTTNRNGGGDYNNNGNYRRPVRGEGSYNTNHRRGPRAMRTPMGGAYRNNLRYVRFNEKLKTLNNYEDVLDLLGKELSIGNSGQKKTRLNHINYSTAMAQLARYSMESRKVRNAILSDTRFESFLCALSEALLADHEKRDIDDHNNNNNNNKNVDADNTTDENEMIDGNKKAFSQRQYRRRPFHFQFRQLATIAWSIQKLNIAPSLWEMPPITTTTSSRMNEKVDDDDGGESSSSTKSVSRNLSTTSQLCGHILDHIGEVVTKKLNSGDVIQMNNNISGAAAGHRDATTLLLSNIQQLSSLLYSISFSNRPNSEVFHTIISNMIQWQRQLIYHNEMMDDDDDDDENNTAGRTRSTMAIVGDGVEFADNNNNIVGTTTSTSIKANNNNNNINNKQQQQQKKKILYPTVWSDTTWAYQNSKNQINDDEGFLKLIEFLAELLTKYPDSLTGIRHEHIRIMNNIVMYMSGRNKRQRGGGGGGGKEQQEQYVIDEEREQDAALIIIRRITEAAIRRPSLIDVRNTARWFVTLATIGFGLRSNDDDDNNIYRGSMRDKIILNSRQVVKDNRLLQSALMTIHDQLRNAQQQLYTTVSSSSNTNTNNDSSFIHPRDINFISMALGRYADGNPPETVMMLLRRIGTVLAISNMNLITTTTTTAKNENSNSHNHGGGRSNGMLSAFQPHGISNLIWSLTFLGIKHATLMEYAKKDLIQRMERQCDRYYNTSSLNNNNNNNDDGFQKLKEDKDGMRNFDGQSVTSIMRNLSRQNVAFTIEDMNIIAEYLKMRCRCQDDDHAGGGGHLGTVDDDDDDMMMTLENVSKVLTRSMLVDAAWSCAISDVYPPELMDIIYVGLFGGDDDPVIVRQFHGDTGFTPLAIRTMIYVQAAMIMKKKKTKMGNHHNTAQQRRWRLPIDFPYGGWLQQHHRSDNNRDIHDIVAASTSDVVDTRPVKMAKQRIYDAFQRIQPQCSDYCKEYPITINQLLLLQQQEVEEVNDDDHNDDNNDDSRTTTTTTTTKEKKLSSGDIPVLIVDVADVKNKIAFEYIERYHFYRCIDDITTTNKATTTAGNVEDVDVDDEDEKLQVDGLTVLKHRLLQNMGWKVIQIPYWEWQSLNRNRNDEMEYCQKLLVEEAKITTTTTIE